MSEGYPIFEVDISFPSIRPLARLPYSSSSEEIGMVR